MSEKKEHHPGVGGNFKIVDGKYVPDPDGGRKHPSLRRAPAPAPTTTTETHEEKPRGGFGVGRNK